MTQREPEQRPVKSARRLFWASAAFYVLIAFEFFYMASPFAVYFYAVYGPGLDWLEGFGPARWTLWFFLPHLVEETRSPLIDFAEPLGTALLSGGLIVFAVGAFQVYRAKLRKDDAVTRGLYRYIRHPQYTALIVASLGMLLVWPRFLVLFSTVAVIFAYMLLARAEEAICLRQYPNYRTYMGQTGMFVPRGLAFLRFPALSGRLARVGLWTVAFLGVLVVATAAAFGLRNLSIASLYTQETPDGVYLSVIQMTDEDLAAVAQIARAAPETEAALETADAPGRMLAYVLPTEMYVSEIPMFLPPGETFGHTVPRDRDPARYKVIFTEVDFGPEGEPDDGNLLASAVNKFPLIEVHVNLERRVVEAIFPPPSEPFYHGIQVPIF